MAYRLSDTPPVPGLSFRLFQGKADLPAMVTVREGVRERDGATRVPSLADLQGWLADPSPEDPYRDCLLAEIDGQVVGYTAVTWWDEVDGLRLYLHLGWLLPQWRRRGIGRAMLRWGERRILEIVQAQGYTGQRMFGGNADDTELDTRALLLSEGYRVAFTVVHMRRDLGDAIPPAVMPPGLELRPVEPAHGRQTWEANEEAFTDAGRWGFYEPWSYEKFQDYLLSSDTDLSLWRVAWDGDQVAGLVMNEVQAQRGVSPYVAVRSPWRRRGLARALMLSTLHAFRERGLTEAALHTLAENTTGSVALYESVGYRIIRRQPRYRKAMP